MRTYDAVVIGGGIVGAAIGYGLAKRRVNVAVLDEGDTALRAARANFGLVWLQSKGDGMPAYGHWTRRSTELWPDFAAELADATGIRTEYEKRGGLVICLGEAELESRRQLALRLHNQAAVYDTEVLDRAALQALVPKMRLGAEVTGASYCPHDGHANPLLLLKALHAALKSHGAAYLPDAPARAIAYRGGSFSVDTPAGPIVAARVVLAAGHGSAALAPALGLSAPIRSERGQILITERLDHFLPLPASGLRQTADGTVMIGATHDNPGFDVSTTADASAKLAHRAVRIAPDLARARLVRTWAGLRVLTPDGCPIYMESATCPGAFLAICHSGVTLAAVHAVDLAGAIADGALPARLAPFHPGRFDVSKAA